jgi:hypothetical protein
VICDLEFVICDLEFVICDLEFLLIQYLLHSLNNIFTIW